MVYKVIALLLLLLYTFPFLLLPCFYHSAKLFSPFTYSSEPILFPHLPCPHPSSPTASLHSLTIPLLHPFLSLTSLYPPFLRSLTYASLSTPSLNFTLLPPPFHLSYITLPFILLSCFPLSHIAYIAFRLPAFTYFSLL